MSDYKGLIWFLIFILLVLIPVLYIKKYSQHSRSFRRIPVALYSSRENKLYHLDLEEYLAGVIAAEMPAKFAGEALKAQAVAARTLAIRRLRRFGGRGCRYYPGADFSDDPAESQAWLPVAVLKQEWGGNFRQYELKVRRAVYKTTGEIMTYHNVPIDAVFHSTCGVGTAAAGEVWNHEVPYLQSERCGFDLESPRYRNNFCFTWKELSRRLKTPEVLLRRMKVVRRSGTGRILGLTLGKQFISGEEFRKNAGLTSTCFTWDAKSAGINFAVTGYGHGVGMCQYGANGMAKQGWNYHRILQHYYRGVQFRKIKY